MAMQLWYFGCQSVSGETLVVFVMAAFRPPSMIAVSPMARTKVRHYNSEISLVTENYSAGFQRRIGLRAAATSSRRLMRVECGAVFTRLGVASASTAMERIASMNKSHSCFDSDSVGSIIIAPGTMSGKAVVYGWKP